MQPSESSTIASHAQEAVRLCRDEAAANRWDRVIAITDNSNLITQQPQLLLQRLQGAFILSDDNIINCILKDLPEAALPHEIKFATVRQLSMNKRAHLAAQLLLDTPSLHETTRFLKSTGLVFKHLRDANLKRALLDLVAKVSRGGSLIKPTATSLTFADQPAQDSFGSVKIVASSKTDKHHLKGLKREVAVFNRLMARPLKPVISEYENVFTHPSGQIWTENKEIVVSKGFPLDVTDRTQVQNISLAFGANRGSSGIYHWLIDYLPRLAWIHSSGLIENKGCRILLNAARSSFEQETLNMLDLGNAVQKLNSTVFVERLLVARVGFRGMLGWRHLDGIYEELGERASALAANNNVELPDRVYVTRRDAVRRVMKNEADVEAVARKLGFTVMEFSKIPLWHQFAIARKASVIMSPHGAGLSHIVVSKPGLRVIEILPIMDGTYQLRFNYARLSIVKGHQYSAWLEPQYPGFDAWTVDLPAFTIFLKKALRESAPPAGSDP
ncbi:glycosyltransferase family 61 protein [Methylobacterium sp. WCS2018Hpa-22]|uniref:glycosyltransferase family 61 protein n=1 Tax=Methylobacterium sp. WCS2018Hpa-22 TaxID=3073633 RepID=UPI00288974BF|nr:glycosyltransferase family 61 protein [Methylobacterium sp. WCS2018Hpa-22]